MSPPKLTCHIDCTSGVSGDMLLGAFVDAGMPLAKLRRDLGKLDLKGYSLRASRVGRHGIMATKVDVRVKGEQPFRKWSGVRRVLGQSALAPSTVRRSLAVMKALFEAEAAVHGGSIDTVHLHELGAVDCMVDVVGTMCALEHFGVGQVSASWINTGGGQVETEHGILPVPAPATARLLTGVPIFSSTSRHELATPTGAAILSVICDGFGLMPEMTLKASGLGAGSMDLPDRSNVVRVMIGERPVMETGDDGILIIETNIDDMDPRIYEHLIERLLELGALDVYLTPVIMKKSRPAVRLTVLSSAAEAEILSRAILEETTTFGLRYTEAGRRILERKMVKTETPYGSIRVKQGFLDGRLVSATPEYEDCRKAALKHGIPLRKVIAAANRKARKKNS